MHADEAHRWRAEMKGGRAAVEQLCSMPHLLPIACACSQVRCVREHLKALQREVLSVECALLARRDVVSAVCSQVEASGGSARHGSCRGEGATAVEGSCTIDALHSGSSHPKAVWWQNAAASSEGGPHDAAAFVLRSGP